MGGGDEGMCAPRTRTTTTAITIFAKKEYEEINAETRCKAGTVHRFCGGFGRGLWVVGW